MVVGVIGFAFGGFFLSLMGSPDDVLPLATKYMRIYFLGMPFNMLYNFGAAVLRAIGDTRRPLYFLTAVSYTHLQNFALRRLALQLAGLHVSLRKGDVLPPRVADQQHVPAIRISSEKDVYKRQGPRAYSAYSHPPKIVCFYYTCAGCRFPLSFVKNSVDRNRRISYNIKGMIAPRRFAKENRIMKKSQEYELRKVCNNLDAYCGFKDYLYNDGPSRGLRAIDLKNGRNIEMTFLADRGLDIPYLSYKGHNVGLVNKVGIRSPYLLSLIHI